jgi:UDP-N-acetylmuramoylalanine--D-glutamate ligase
VNGRTFYNDSKATNADSALAAVRAMTEKTVWILGGYDKKQSFGELFYAAKRFPEIVNIVLYGGAADKMAAAADAAGAAYVKAGGLADATVTAYYLCPEGGCVLLSPACASFDEFRSYGERGERFIETVRSLRDET